MSVYVWWKLSSHAEEVSSGLDYVCQFTHWYRVKNAFHVSTLSIFHVSTQNSWMIPNVLLRKTFLSNVLFWCPPRKMQILLGNRNCDSRARRGRRGVLTVHQPRRCRDSDMHSLSQGSGKQPRYLDRGQRFYSLRSLTPTTVEENEISVGSLSFP